MTRNWTREMESELLRLWKRGLTGLQIGERMGFTRSAILGKLSRLRQEPNFNRRIKFMSPWDEESTATLKKLAAEGRPTAVIAAAVGMSYYQVRTKSQSLKIRIRPQERRGKLKKISRESRCKLKKTKCPSDYPHGPQMSRTNFEITASEFDRKIINDPSRTTRLLDLTARTCRWPLGEPGSSDFQYCGGPAEIKKPYCPHHTIRAAVPKIIRAPKQGASP